MKICIATDHAGFTFKEALIPFLRDELGHEVEDFGAHKLDESDDYPDFITPCAKAVAADPESFGIILGASGQAEAMCANRTSGVRCALYYGEPPHMQIDALGHELDMITSVRSHNNANMLSLGARFLTEHEAKEAIKRFLATPFSGDIRHVARLAKF